MSEIIKQWIQDKLGIIINLSPETFCELTRDGLLLCRILRVYEVINQDQLKMIEKSDVRSVRLSNFQEHIVYWLKIINIHLTSEDIIDIVDCNGLSSLSLFYRIFLELHEKDCLTFISKNKLSEKLHPKTPKYTVVKVNDKPPDKLIDNKYKDNLDNTFDVIHWLQDRLEMVVSKCKSAREEYLHILRTREKRMSSTFSVPSITIYDDTCDQIDNVSEITLNMTYEQLINEKNNVRKAEKFKPNFQHAQQILEKMKQKLRNKQENKVFMKELQKHIVQDFFVKLVNEESEDVSNDIAEKIIKQSFYEKQMQNKLREIKYQRENMLQSKQILNESIAKEREQEFIEKLMQKKKIEHKEEFEYYLEKERAQQLHKVIYTEKLRLKAEKTFNSCEDAIKGICKMAIKFTEYKSFFGEQPSEKIMDCWRKRINDKEAPAPAKVTVADVVTKDRTKIEQIVHCEIEKQNQLDKNDFDNYQEFKWPWVLQNNITEEEVKEMDNGMRVLGHFVHLLLNIKYPLPIPPSPPDLPKVNVRVCLIGLPELTCLKVLKKMLSHKKIIVIELQDAVNFCLDKFKEENSEDNESIDEEQTSFIYDKEVPEVFHKKGAKSFSSTGGNSQKEINLDKKNSDKCIQTPKFYPNERVTLSPMAELGRIAFEELCAGNCLTDFLLVSIFIEYLKSKQDEIKGWVLINYPTTFDQAVLFEESISGLTIPAVSATHKILKSLTDIVYMCDENTQDLKELRHSHLVPDPAEKREPLAYDTVLTAFINVEQAASDLSSENDVAKELQDVEDYSKLQQFYTDQGCNYSVYYQHFDYFTIKHIAKLVIGEFSIPPKPSIELFGETITYLDLNKGDDKKSIISLKHGDKKDPDRIEKVIKKSSIVASPKKAPSLTVEAPSGRKSKIFSHVVREDKWTQIPEIKTIELDQEEIIKPGEFGYIFEKLLISEDIGMILVDIWEKMEEIYINDLHQVFFQKRVISNMLLPYVEFAKNMIRKYIVQTDQRQLFLRKFQEKFNEFDNDFRKDKEFKAELHCLIDELQNRFIYLADLRMMRAEQQRKDFVRESWGPKQMVQLLNNYISGFQIELDRNCDTLSFINDYFTALITKVPCEDIPPKEILQKYNADSTEIEQDINHVYIKFVSKEANPFAHRIDHVYRKAMGIAERYENNALANFDKISALFLTGPNKKAVKPKTSLKGGILAVFEPSENIKQNAQHIFECWESCLKGELARIKIRLQLLKSDASTNLDIFFNTLKNTYKSLYEENKSRFETEINSFKNVCYVLSLAVEREIPVQDELILVTDEFSVNPENILFEDSIDIFDRPVEPPEELVSTLNQLQSLIEIFVDLGPDGYLSERAFTFLLQDMALNSDQNLVPKEWMKLTGPNISNISKEMFGPQKFVCWKDFIIYNLILPFPTVDELIETRNYFSNYDDKRTELIHINDYQYVNFWFEADEQLDVDEIKKLLFRMYQVDENFSNYTAMLFDFCKSDNTIVGIAMALAVVCGKPVCWDKSIGNMFMESALEDRAIHNEQINKPKYVIRVLEMNYEKEQEYLRQLYDDIETDIDPSDDDSSFQEDDEDIQDFINLPSKCVKLRDNEIKEHMKFARTIVDRLIDNTVHLCDSLTITEIPNDDQDTKGTVHNQTADSVTNEIPTDEQQGIGNQKKESFCNVGYEVKKYPSYNYFINLNDIFTVVNRTFNWRNKNSENSLIYEFIEELYITSRNPMFNNQVFSHKFLNNSDFLKIFSTTKKFLIVRPYSIVEKFLVEAQLREL